MTKRSNSTSSGPSGPRPDRGLHPPGRGLLGRIDGGDSTTPARGRAPGRSAATPRGNKNAPKAYVVKNGDTLTAIAHDTGVPVATIQRLNPGVDPQILISGEKLKLR